MPASYSSDMHFTLCLNDSIKPGVGPDYLMSRVGLHPKMPDDTMCMTDLTAAQVHKLMQKRDLEERLQHASGYDGIWEAMKAGQEENIAKRAGLQTKIREFKQCALDLSKATGGGASAASSTWDAADIDVERS